VRVPGSGVVLALVLIDILLQVVEGTMTFVFLRPGWAEELKPARPAR